MIVKRMLMKLRPVVENHPQMLSWQSSVMKRMPIPSFDPLSNLSIFLRATGPEANHCYWRYIQGRPSTETSDLLMRSLAAKLLLGFDSSAKSGGVFTQHVLSGCASTLLVSRFHFRLSHFHVAC